MSKASTAEHKRLDQSRQRTQHWKRWGPYVSERAWGTVREDYSANGTAWDYFPHDHARSRAYRWSEDGLASICDRHQMICFSVALWNGCDPFLKERAFGLTGSEGNHGEDVKEYFYYLDSTPTHSYMKYLYKYPQAAFPYSKLVEENRGRGRDAPEFDLIDTGVFEHDRYFDIFVEYAKTEPEDILIKIAAINRGPEAARLNLVPTIWFRNRWSWGDNNDPKPSLRRGETTGVTAIELKHFDYGQRYLFCEGSPELLFTENETNNERLFNAPNGSPYVKDGINEYILHGNKQAVNPSQSGTKGVANYSLVLEAGDTATIRLRFTTKAPSMEPSFSPFDNFDQIFADRIREADEFYQTVIPENLSEDTRLVMRQALAGLLWSKQYYHYIVEKWLYGDPKTPPPSAERQTGRNRDWKHLYNSDVISMPDKWEYPWYASWDLAFHCVSLALVDYDFAKEQLVLFLREWYMHPNGQLPAYEWALGDVNPPVHAWAAWRVYKIEQKTSGKSDRKFLERVFHKLMLNFTWWVNRKDAEGNNIFEGGFLGLDNIGLFDRGRPLPGGGHLEQSDGTSWMAMYTLNLLTIALELAREDPAYEDLASKFWEHFIHIANAMNNISSENIGLWDQQDGFYYDVLHLSGGYLPLRVRSIVGLIPLFAVLTVESNVLESFPDFKRRLEWFVNNRPDLTEDIATMRTPGIQGRKLVGLVRSNRLRSMLRYMLDEQEFLSPYGIRSVSRFHESHPYVLGVNGEEYSVAYEPAESTTSLFGGNSNWRGPIWFPINYLIIESLQRFHEYYGDDFKIECPTGSGQLMNLGQVAGEVAQRLSRIFLRREDGTRPMFGDIQKFQRDPHWRNALLFHEYFNGDTGAGLGASHQTGWTALVANLLCRKAE
ncbi:MAG TPA: hypothetical protein VJ372_09465 [Pyrinomonadaceae bacterium]|nr:hypothetical protein [Pyrinomonadaceae bacterium]